LYLEVRHSWFLNHLAFGRLTDAAGAAQRVVKGAFAVVAALVRPQPAAAAVASALEEQGCRVLPVAAGPAEAMLLAGLIALSDPPRADSSALVRELRALGVRTVMVTGAADSGHRRACRRPGGRGVSTRTDPERRAAGVLRGIRRRAVRGQIQLGEGVPGWRRK
jgi:cation transport ATPase